MTDKFNPNRIVPQGTIGGNNGPGDIGNRFNFRDANGNVVSSLALDGNNQTTFSRQLTAADLGYNNLSGYFTGGNGYAPGGFNGASLKVGNSNQVKGVGVTQIVAGPGIYISAPNGQGVVTISASPISATITQDDLYDIVWTQTISSRIPGVGDNSQFTAVGQDGINLRSRDGVNFTEMGPRLALSASGGLLTYDHVNVLQSNEFKDYGTIYFSSVAFEDQSSNIVAVGTAWGRLGYRTDEGVPAKYLDALGPVSDNGRSSTGTDITGEGVGLSRVYQTSTASFTASLTVIYGSNGAIWSVAGIPCDFYDNVSFDGTQTNVTWNEELNLANGRFWSAASNLEDNPSTNFQIVTVYSSGSTYRIYRSNRNGNGTSTWTNEQTPVSPMYTVCYGTGTFIAAGAGDDIYISTDDGDTWTLSNTGWPASVWYGSAYGNGKFVLVGVDGHCVFSEDNGVTWTRAVTNTKETLNAIAYSPTLNKFVAVGAKRTIVSVDG